MGPVWLAQLATSTKSFRDNPIIGSRLLNARGLHVRRTIAAHRMAERRRARLASRVNDRDRAAFDRDGFVVRRAFLPSDAFAALRDQLARHRGRASETSEGDTLVRKIRVDRSLFRAAPALRALTDDAVWRGLLAYVGACDAAPSAFVKSLYRGAGAGGVDTQSRLHADTFHPTVKAWLFLTDVEAERGAFTYVPGSHRLTPERLAWEQRMSLEGPRLGDPDSAHGSLRIDPSELGAMGLPEPQPIAVPANSLVVADTFGFHCRGSSREPSRRVAVWAMGPRCPFLPWPHLDLGLAGVGRTRSTTEWRPIEAYSAFDDLARG